MSRNDDPEELLLSPGPVPVSRAVREAMTAPMVSHRSAAFEDVYRRVQEGLDRVFTRSTPDGTTTSAGGTSLILNGTATMGMEAAVANLVDSEDEVLAVVNGKFGRRFARIADRHAQCRRVSVPWGESIDPDAVAEAISAETALVTMVHNETSTGLLNPVAEVGAVAAEHDVPFVVDGVTSIGGDEFRIEDWHVDIAITDAQKALAAPPGISGMYVTDGIQKDLDGPSAPFYADLDWYIEKSADDQTPFTSAVPLFRAMAVALEEIEAEGMGTRIDRHRRQARAFRTAFETFDLDLFPAPAGPTEYSNTVTAVSLPAEIENPDTFFGAIEDEGVSISGGQAHLGGDIVRVSNMGGLTGSDIRRGIRAIGAGLAACGRSVDIEAGVAAANEHLA